METNEMQRYDIQYSSDIPVSNNMDFWAIWIFSLLPKFLRAKLSENYLNLLQIFAEETLLYPDITFNICF